MARIVRAVARRAALFGERRQDGPPRHFLDIDRYQTAELRDILDLGFAYKNGRRDRPLEGKTLAMIFEKPSTRTRVSFDMAIRQLGGTSIVLEAGTMQLGRGETIADTARVLSRYVDAVMIRTDDINLYPSNNALGTVVAAADIKNIDTVIIGGVIRKSGGKMIGVKWPMLRAQIDESRNYLFQKAGYKLDIFSA